MPKVDRWCPKCGFDILLDTGNPERCAHCGSLATGPGVEKIDLMVEIMQGLLNRATWENGNGELRSLGSGTLAIAIRFWASLGFCEIAEDNGGLHVVAERTPMNVPLMMRGTLKPIEKAPLPTPPPAPHGRTRRKNTV